MRQLARKFNPVLLLWILATVVLYYGRTILIPLTFAALLAMLMSPLSRWLDRRGLHRAFSSGICVLILLAVAVFFIVVLVAQASSFRQELPQIEEKVNRLIASANDWLAANYDVPVEEQRAALQKGVQRLGRSSGTYITRFLGGVTSTAVNLIITLVVTFLLLFGRERYYTFFTRITGGSAEEKAEVLTQIAAVAQKYLLGRVLSMGALFVMYYVSLLLIGIENAFLLAAIGALVNIIPYIGPLLAGVFPLLAALATEDATGPAVWVFITFSVVQAVDNYFVTPFFMGGEVSLSALATILAIICGGYLWGVAGMILFVPMLSIAKIIFDRTEGLEPYGYLIGDPAGGSPTQKFRDWLRKKFGKK